MASANQKKTTFISQKLAFLKDQGDQLNRAVRMYLNVIIAAGESWTEGGDNKMKFPELCQMIDTAVEFLWEKSEELADRSVAGSPISDPSCQQSDLTSNATAAPTSAVFSSQHTEPVQPTDEIQLKPVLARIAIIEDALCSYRSNAETVAQRQSGIDQQLKELLSKLTDLDTKNNLRFRKIKEQISEISDTHDSIDQLQETRLQSLENQLQKLSTAQDRLEIEVESQVELTEKLVHVPDQLESVKENLDELEARIDKIIDDCNNKHQDIENVWRVLADNVKSNTYTVNVISEGQDKTTNLLQELETRIQTLEADSERNLTDVRKQAERGETNFRILCQMLNDRLTPLEKLRTCLNERATGTDENIRKLSKVVQDVAVMSPRLQQLELKSSRTRCGFTADRLFSRQAAGDTIKRYSPPLSNVGGNFNAYSGIFTAPVDGLYVTSVSLYLYGDGEVEVSVRYKKQGQGQSSGKVVCRSLSTVKDTTACTMGVVDMKAGDTLSIYLDRRETSSVGIVWFSSFLLA